MNRVGRLPLLRNRYRFVLAGACLAAALATSAVAAAPPENLAPRATATASSEFSSAYQARFATDGAIPDSLGHDDVNRAWAVNGAQSREHATFTLSWPEPVTVAEIAYFGRTAWLIEECWRDYELRIDDEAAPAFTGRFEMGSGPQTVQLQPPRRLRKLTFQFLSSYGGPNPGASEIQVYAEPTPPGFLPRFRKSGWEMPEESPALAAEVREHRLGVDALVVVERHELNPSHVYSACCEGFQPGGGLCVLSPPAPDGALRRLVESPTGQILDADVSFDGREILFSWRRQAGEGYHLWRIGADGSGLTQLTDGDWHDYNACWLPDGGIAFVSTRATVFALCFVTPAGVLYRMDRDGGGVRRLSANYVNDFTPSVLPDGRILYSRWEYVDRPAIPIQSLWAIRPDGTGLSVFYGNRVLSPASFLEARAMPDSPAVLCTLTAHNGPIRGAVGYVDRRWGVNAQAAIRNLTPAVDIGRTDRGDGNHVRGPFENPCPLDRDRFLVSGRGSIFVGDLADRWAMVREKSGALGYYNPVPLRSRPRPPLVQALAAEPDATEATVLVADVYRGLEPFVGRGEIRRLAIVEEVAKQLRTDVLGFGFQRPVISCGAAYAVKKIWGYAEVEADGSACFRVPANRPLYFEALDEAGRAVQRMRSFAHFAPGETQGCQGCHEPRLGAPPRIARPLAARRPPASLQAPEWGTETFDYWRVVQPVFDALCVRCHSGANAPRRIDLSGGKTDWFNVSYDVLTRGFANWIDTRNGQEQNILRIEPKTWGSPVSRLAAVVVNGHPGETGPPRVTVDRASRERVLAWIDLNVPYYGTYDMDSPTAEGGRRLYPAELDPALADVAQRRCAACHPAGRLPSAGFVRISEPALNDFLVAPLAKTAGGRQSCGQPVFAGTADPDYQRLLRTVERSRDALQSRPRIDMPGSQVTQANRSCL